MVRKATRAEQQAWDVLPSATDIARRKQSSFILMIALLTITTPFTPFCWLGCFDFIDYFISTIALLGALYFHYVIAGIVAPVTIKLFDRRFVRTYQQRMFWYFAISEVLVVVGVRWYGSEIVRRLASLGVVSVLWVIGWTASSKRAKNLGWHYVWWVWGCMLLCYSPRHATCSGRRW
jgi:hypothetical protein